MRYETRDEHERPEGLLETMQQNPIPTALVGLGLTWLWVNRRTAPPRPARAVQASRRDYGGDDAGEQSRGGNPVTQAAGRAGEVAGHVAGTVGGTVGSAAASVGDTVGGVASRVGETVGNVAGMVGETASGLVGATQEAAGNLVGGTREAAGGLAEEAQFRALLVEERAQNLLRESPLAVGAIALTLGAAAGFALPQTRRENQLMGGARDALVERAQEVAHETVEKVQGIAAETGHTVEREAKAQGLTSRA